MRLTNREIAGLLTEIADLLEIDGDNPFRIRAYRNAALTLETEGRQVAEMLDAETDLTELEGIGQDLAQKIIEAHKTGKIKALAGLRKKFPKSITELLKIASLGPKKVSRLYREMHISSQAQLKKAAQAGKIREMKGFGAKTEERILQEITRLESGETHRLRWIEADEEVQNLLAFFKAVKGIEKIDVAGSYRRKQETVGDIDVLVCTSQGEEVLTAFLTYPRIKQVNAGGPLKASAILHSGVQVDVRTIEPDAYGAALLYFTGSKAHNVILRQRAMHQHLKVNEYGIFKGTKRVSGKTEADMYQTLGLAYIEPELRENRGEIEAAQKDTLPHLVKLSDIRGDLHIHTTESDGASTLEEMAKAANALGYEYVAITDHSQRLTVANGLTPDRLRAHIKKIDELNKKLKTLRILKSAEVDILEDGRLDYSDELLKELDLVVCSLHHKFQLPSDKQTERALRAMDNRYMNILAHPTGRLIHQRTAYAIDVEKLIVGARDRGVVLEMNAQPARLDLNDVHGQLVRELGGKVVISTDAHRDTQLRYMRLGVSQARRAWLEKKQVINTLPLEKLLMTLRR
jgi:DNA polymerase (family 10)